MNEEKLPEKWGWRHWREKLVDGAMSLVGTGVFTSPHGLTPDNVTFLKFPATFAALIVIVAGGSIGQFILYVAVAVLADMFDGAIHRVLERRGLTAPPIFLSKWLPFLKGGTFDAISDKIAMFTGLCLVAARGYPLTPIFLLYFWSVAKIAAACHGAWLTGLNYRDLGRLVIRRPPVATNFREELSRYLAIMTNPVYVGKVEINMQLAGLITALLWLIWPMAWLVKLGKIVGCVTIGFGYTSYRMHLRRFLVHHSATFRPGGLVWLPLADSTRNRGFLPRLLTRFIMWLALYRVKRPT